MKLFINLKNKFNFYKNKMVLKRSIIKNFEIIYQLAI